MREGILKEKVAQLEKVYPEIDRKISLVLTEFSLLKSGTLAEIAQLTFRVGAIEREAERKTVNQSWTVRTVLKAGLDLFMAVTLTLALYKMGLK